MFERLIANNYSIVETLSVSRTTSVFKAVNTTDHAPVALKCLNRSLQTPDALESFRREFTQLTHLSHPLIPKAYHVGSDPELGHFMSMQFASTSTLRTAHEIVTPYNMRQLLLQLAHCLDYLHGRGILHCNISPENICIVSRTADGPFSDSPSSALSGIQDLSPVPMLIDFGMAQPISGNSTIALWGTSPYLAPEVLFGLRPTPQSDMYSLAACIAHAFVSFDRTSASYGTEFSHQAVRDLLPNTLDRTLHVLLNRMLSTDPEDRPQRFWQVITSLVDDDTARRHSRIFASAGLPGVPLQGLTHRRARTFIPADCEPLKNREHEPASHRVVFITGEPGIGKTRLLSEFEIVTGLMGYVPVRIACTASGFDVMTQLQSMTSALLTETRSVLTVKRDLENAGDLAVTYLKYLPLTASRSATIRRKTTPESSNVTHDNHKLRALTTLLQRVLQFHSTRPTALLFDDVDNANPETLELIRLLAVQSHGPVLVATCDNDYAARPHLSALFRFLLQRTDCTHHKLERLTLTETTNYLSDALATSWTLDDSARQLHELTAGIPSLLEDTVRALLHGDELYRDSIGWHLTNENTKHIQLPTNLRDFARTLLSTLTPRIVRLLEIMAVHHTSVSLTRLRMLTNRDEVALRADLSSLVTSGIVSCSTDQLGEIYGFKHGCVREYVYTEMPTIQKQSLHRRIGEALETSAEPLSDDSVAQLARHFIEGLDQTKGPTYAFSAAYIALERSATERAIELFISGLNLTPAAETDRRFEGLETVSALLALSGDIARASDYYREMLLLARTVGAPDREALAIRELGELLIECGELDRGLAYSQDAELRHRVLGDIGGEARAIGMQAQALRKAGKFKAAADVAARSYSKALESDDVYVQSLARSLEGLIAIDLGAHGRAVELMEHALALKNEINDLGGITIMQNNIGLAYLEQGALERARPYFMQALTSARERGLSLTTVLASLNLGEIHRLTGHCEIATELLNEAQTISESTGRKQFLAYALYSRACVEIAVGHLAAAHRDLSHAETLCRESGGRSDLCLIYSCQIGLFKELGMFDSAKQRVELACKLAHELGVTQFSVATVSASIDLQTVCVLDAGNELASLVKREDVIAGGRRLDRVWFAWSRSLIALSEDRASDALVDIDEMKGIAKESGLRPEVARACLLEGQALMKLQRRNEARLVLEQGVELARDMGLRPLLSHLLYWLSQAQEAMGEVPAAVDSVFEAADLINKIASEIKDDEMRRSYLEVPENLAARGHAERLERAGMQRRPREGEVTRDPGVMAAAAFDEASRQLGAEASLRSLLTATLDRIIETIRADRGLVILLDTEEAEVTIARNLEGETIRDATDYCRGILQTVSSGESILAVDVPGDERFRNRPSVALYNIQCLMCVPLTMGGRVLGAVYFDSRSGDRRFRQDDLRLVEAFSARMSTAISEAQEAQRVRDQAVMVNRELARRYHLDNLVGESPAMQRVFRMMDAVIRADCNVLVTGESGTGKELVARAIHFAGARKLRNFVPVDCGAIPENLIESELFGYRKGAFTGADTDKKGLFEEADGGTLFLDEITNTTPAFQAKLLRMLQSGEFRRLGETLTRRADVRIIAATNRDVDQAIRQGLFREDLYYRLNVVTLALPPLRDRAGDIPLLAEHFARQFCEARGIPFQGVGRAALARLIAYPWPGNLRELEHAVEAALVVSGDGMVRRDTLPEKVLGGELESVRDLLEASSGAAAPRQEARAAARNAASVAPAAVETQMPAGHGDEKRLVERALLEAGGDKSRAARLLGWNRMRLYRRLKTLGISYETGKDIE